MAMVILQAKFLAFKIDTQILYLSMFVCVQVIMLKLNYIHNPHRKKKKK